MKIVATKFRGAMAEGDFYISFDDLLSWLSQIAEAYSSPDKKALIHALIDDLQKGRCNHA